MAIFTFFTANRTLLYNNKDSVDNNNKDNGFCSYENGGIK